MYCKLEGGFGNYVSYADVDRRHLSKIVEIKFEGLKGNAFSGAARSVDWSKLTKLRKIEGVNSDLNSYTFQKKTFSNLEEIKFTKCGLSAETLNSLLDAVPNIETAQNFKFAWDVLSSISTAELFDDEEEDAFQLASERIEIIQIAQKKHGKDSGETTVLDEYSVVDTEENDDALSEFNFELDEGEDYDSYYSSETGDSYSDSERLEGGFVPKASERNSTLSEKEARRLDTLYHSGLKPKKTDMQIDGDEESSVESVQVRRLPEKNLKQLQDDQDAETLSTLSRGPNRDSGDSGSRLAVDVEPWEYLEDDVDAGNKSGLRAGGKQRTTHDLEDRSRSAAGVKVLVTYHPSTSANSSLYIDSHLTQEEFNNLSKSERAQIKALVINGNGPDGPDVGDTIDWSGLSRLEGLRLKLVTVEQPLSEKISFAGLKSIYFENCGVDSSAFESFSKASPELEEMDAKALYGLSISDNSWRDLNESETELILHTLGQENLYEPDFDSSIQSAPVSVVTRSYIFEEELKRGDSYHRSSNTISSVNAEDSGIFCFLGNETFSKLYSTLTDMELGQVTRIIYIGTGTNDNAMRQVDWSKLPSLRDVNIENAAVVGDHSFGDVKFSNLKSINFKNCRIGLSAIERFSGSSSVQLSQFGMDHCVTNHDEERDDILRIQEKVNYRGLFPIKVGEVGEVGEREDDDLDLDSLSEGENPRYKVPVPLSPSFTRNLKTAQPDILCYYSEERAPIPYSSEFSARFLPLITKIEYRGRGPQDNAMETVPWAKLTGLESLFISNASVSDATSFQGQGGKTLFSQLTKMSFDGCKLGPKAIDGFVKHASEDLTELNISSDCEVASESGLQAIEALKSRVNSRTQEDMGRRGMYSPGSNRSESSTPRSSNRTTIRSEDGEHNRKQSASRGPSSTGVAAGAAMNRQSLFTSSHAQHRTAGVILPSVRTAGAIKTEHFQNRIRELCSREPVLVVGNESVNSRDYDKLCCDTEGALRMIQAANPSASENYMLFQKGRETINIAYQADDHSMTSILDASIDTVRVHRGWREVDTNISNEARAEIIIASLGIPPCPPDIAISNESSRLGRAIRAEFTKLQQDHPEIIVRRCI